MSPISPWRRRFTVNLDRTSLIGIAVCVFLYIGYENFLNTKYPSRYERQEVKEEIAKQSSSSVKTTLSKNAISYKSSTNKEERKDQVAPVKLLSEEALTLETDKTRFILDQRTGGFKNVELKDYLDENKENPISLLNDSLYITASTQSSFSYPETPFSAKKSENGSITFSKEENNWLIEQVIELDPSSPYGLKLSFSWTNLSEKQRNLTSSVFFAENVKFRKAVGSSFLPGMPTHKQSVASHINRSSEWNDIESFCAQTDGKPAIASHNSFVGFSGFDQHYFLKAFLPEAKQSNLLIQKLSFDKDVSCSLYLKHSLEQGGVKSGEKAHFNFKAWFGPKSQNLMSAYSGELKEAVDLGMFAQISHVFLKVLRYLHSLLGNWGLSIIVFTLLLKTLLYPLVRSSSKSMHKMKALQPAMNAIKEKYKNDPQRQQKETLQFMSKHKVNPLKGCLPILPQFPLFIACWRTLSSTVELRHAPFFGWISDLSSQDPYYITPLLLGACLFLQQKLTPTTGMDKTQEKMLLFMPIMFSLFMLTLPAGMVLYSLTNSVISIAQQQWLNRKLQTA